MLRLALGVTAIAAWALALFLATHTSVDRAVLGRYSPAFAVLLASVFSFAVLITAAHWKPVFERVNSAKANLGVLAGSIALSLTGLELLIRSADLFGVSYYEENSRYHQEKVADPTLVYRHRPNLAATYQGVSVRTNELGLRDDPIGPKDEGELRVLILGDSVTFGWGVAEEYTFTALLESRLSDATGYTAQVINSGVGSYNTEQEADFLEQYRAEIAPDLVLLLYVTNDIEVQGAFEPVRSWRGKSPPQMFRTLLGGLWTYRLAAHLVRALKNGRDASVQRGEGWDRSMAALDRIVLECRTHTIPLVVFLYEHIPDSTTRALRMELATRADADGFLFSSTEQWLNGQDPRELTLSVVDSHPNPQGHERLAKGMQDFLLENRDEWDRPRGSTPLR